MKTPQTRGMTTDAAHRETPSANQKLLQDVRDPVTFLGVGIGFGIGFALKMVAMRFSEGTGAEGSSKADA
jgi:hypothetical protein